MRLVTANIGRKASVQHTRADFETIRRLRGITGFQEIDEADAPPEHSLLKAVLSSGYELGGLAHYVPIAVPKRGYKLLRTRDVYATGGVKHWSPTRFFTVATVKSKAKLRDRIKGRTDNVFIVINTHYPAGGYHGERPPEAKKELIKHWDEQFVKHRELVKHYADKGYTVFWTGDVNRTTMPKVHPREVQVVTVGIDSISYVEGNVKVKVKHKGSAKLFSDHNAQYVDFILS
jgi:hypothetical protein